MKEIIIGYGQIGKAVHEAIAPDAVTYDTNNNQKPVSSRLYPDVMHICFPYSEGFVENVKDYIKRFEPKHIVVYSTVPIGTCRKIDERVVHSPVEGVHPHLAESIRVGKRWLGWNVGDEGRFFEDYFSGKLDTIRQVENTETTEYLKLRSTAKYGINLVWTEYEYRVAKELGMAFSEIQQFDEDYNELYYKMDKPEFSRYILFPPNGKIGGHCVVPNAKLLNEQFPSILLDQIIEMEEK